MNDVAGDGTAPRGMVAPAEAHAGPGCRVGVQGGRVGGHSVTPAY